jgi:hypothetical protein
MTVSFSIPLVFEPDSTWCPDALFEVDYELLASGLVVANGTVRFHCGTGQFAGVAEDSGEPIYHRSLNVLEPSFPNPFNPTTTLRYHVIKRATVELRVYDVQGRMVKNLVSQVQDPGTYRIHWDGTDQSDGLVAPGTYFGVVEIDGIREARKMILVK